MLPPELWRTILRDATYVPLLLIKEWDYDYNDRMWAGFPSQTDDGNYKAEILASDITKRAIVLVSRAWHQIGSEFLYEAIQIPRNLNWTTQLMEIMKHSATEPKHGAHDGVGHAYGYWTKMIEWRDHSLLYSKPLGAFMALLELCPNLQILCISGHLLPTALQVRLAGKLKLLFPRSLRRLEILSSIMDGEASDRFLDAIPNIALTSLSITCPATLNNLPLHSNFDKISTLTLHLPIRASSLPTQWHLPNLRSLTMTSISDQNGPATIEFIMRHRRTVLNLYIRPADRKLDPRPLVTAASNARSLTVKYATLSCLGYLAERESSKKAGLPGITHLGIVFEGGNNAGPFEDALVHVLAANMFPDLVVFRLHQTSRLKDRENWIGLRDMLQRHNIRFEDGVGNEFVSVT